MSTESEQDRLQRQLTALSRTLHNALVAPEPRDKQRIDKITSKARRLMIKMSEVEDESQSYNAKN